MRYTDLLGATVYASDGERIGVVHDLGFERWSLVDGRTEFRLRTLECRDSLAIGHRFGYGKGEMAGPWPLDRIFVGLQRRTSVLVDWRDVARRTPDRIDLRRTRREMRGSEDSA
jgi:PRC-barrel domain